MPSPIDPAVRQTRRAVASLILVVLFALAFSPAPAASGAPRSPAASESGDPQLAARGWVWPVRPFRLVRAFIAPAHEYGPGHRGIDLDPLGGSDVRAPAAGTVAFAGSVAGRGILTIDHGDGLVSTLEPVQISAAPGAPVAADEIVATVSIGGHAASGTLHFGVRLHGDYINPMLLLGTVPRAILLPCCD